jgi:predicted RNA-binding Zn ribbon-like protein
MDRPEPFLVGDDLALDFLNSIAKPSGEPIEWLSNGADLVDWLARAGAVPREIANQYRSSRKVRALDMTATKARELREWFRSFVANHSGKRLGPDALRKLAPLNDLLSRDDAFRQIECNPHANASKPDEAGAGALQWSVRRRWRTSEALLFPVAQAMGELVCQKDFSLVRKCEAPSCTLYFHDVSKGHARRWCSMAVCGNRAKAAAHRARQSTLH